MLIVGAGRSVFLSGDNYDSLSDLHNVSIGDIITINSAYGKTFAYKVTHSSRALPDITIREPVAELNGTSDVLQICSCADDLGNNKHLVKAELIQGANTA